jgi:multiple sugar transport system permease protein
VTTRERWFYLLISPWLIGLVFLQLLPLVSTALLSLTRWEPPVPPAFVGLGNFASLVADDRFLHSLYNTAVYAVATVVPGLIIGLGLAMLLRSFRRGSAVAQATVVLPAVVAGVATALMWGWIFNPRFGLLNGLLALVGIDGPAWLRDPAWAMPAMVLMGIWNIGVNVVIYIAALNTVPRDLHEAAQLDGAGRVARFWNVTWPALTPITFYLAVVNAIAAFQVFTPAYLLTGGGPEDATLTTALYTYETAFSSGQLGYASAMTLVVLGLIVLLTVGQFRFAGRRVEYSIAD